MFGHSSFNQNYTTYIWKCSVILPSKGNIWLSLWVESTTWSGMSHPDPKIIYSLLSVIVAASGFGRRMLFGSVRSVTLINCERDQNSSRVSLCSIWDLALYRGMYVLSCITGSTGQHISWQIINYKEHLFNLFALAEFVYHNDIS